MEKHDHDEGLISELYNEVLFFVGKINEEDSQEMRRALCRSVFQFVDGVSSDLKSNIAFYESPNLIGEEFYLSLFDKIKVTRDGKDTEITRRPGFAKNLDFAFDAFGDVAGIEINIKENKAEWDRFNNCISIRNRVVHPKNISDLNISDDDIKEMMKMLSWLHETLCDSCHKTAMSYLNQARGMEHSLFAYNSH